MSHPPALIIHGHFYQPPRDNPWTGIVDREPSALPAHDWNERIHRECYRPNGWARMFDDRGRVADIVNNYASLSFNFGPTLLSWLDRHDPQCVRRLVDADRASLRRTGHGNAMAQGYNHAILPLCNDRDLVTQVRWGMHDFRSRFGRDAEALWLPETACDARTLGVLIDQGLKFAVLAPGQAARVKVDGEWQDVSDGSIDPRQPYRWCHPDGSGRELALFFYDGAISRGIAFEGALSSSKTLLDLCEKQSGGSGALVHAVTDGESYGHHFKFGDRCLSHALSVEAPRRGFWVTNYAAFLARHPPVHEVAISEGPDGRGTSWSCAHGVGRWFRDCGCHTGGEPGWTQAWRTPLRAALNDLRDHAASVYERRMGELSADPWGLRDHYLEVWGKRESERRAFFEQHGVRAASERCVEALRLLEMQRSAMTMFTSCGWFFNDVSGIETVQILRSAGRLVDQLAELGEDDGELAFVAQLAEAHSNVGGSAADVYRREVLPAKVHDARLAAHISLSGLAMPLDGSGEVADRRFRLIDHTKLERGRVTVATQQVALEHVYTGAMSHYGSCTLYFGGVDLHCVLAAYPGDEPFGVATGRIWDAATRGSLLTLVRVAEETLGPDDHGIEALLPSARADVSRALFDDLRERYAAQYEAMYRDARLTIAQFYDAGLPLPDELRRAAELALAYRFDEEIAAAPSSGFDARHYERAIDIAEEATRFGCELRRASAQRHFETLLEQFARRIAAGDGDGRPIDAALSLLAIASSMGLTLCFDRSQEVVFEALGGGAVSAELSRLLAAIGISDAAVGGSPAPATPA